MAWTLSIIRDRVRQITGRRSITQTTDASIDFNINEFYINRLPKRVNDLKVFDTLTCLPTDLGVYTITDCLGIRPESATINGNPVTVFDSVNQASFFAQYPEVYGAGDDQILTAPALTAAGAGLTYSTFRYHLAGYGLTKAAGSISLAGATVIPSAKFGGYRIEIDADGVFSVVSAAGNATGYGSQKAALVALQQQSSEDVCVGWVLVPGPFTPGVTTISEIVDGHPGLRSTPAALLWHNSQLYLGPKPDDIYLLRFEKFAKPAALVGDASIPLKDDWGLLIAYGAAIIMMLEDGTLSQNQDIVKMYENLLDSVNAATVKQMSTTGFIQRRW